MAATKQDRAVIARAGKIIMASLTEQVAGVLREARDLPTDRARWLHGEFALPAGGCVRISVMVEVELPAEPAPAKRPLMIEGPR